jgi:L-ascorbate metabolism protein UlaG (beta-lactamase superfamily)
MPAGFAKGLNDKEQITIDDFTFCAIAAAHNTIDRDEKGQCRCVGYIIKFGKWTIYHSGDTLWYDGLENILSAFDIDLALLPINGNNPARGVAGNLDTDEAAALSKAAKIKHVIPCHYDMFTFNTANPKAFADKAMALHQPYTILPIGGHWSREEIV